MKTIVVSGAHSNVGKTTLAHRLCSLIPGAVAAKIGHCAPKVGKPGNFYPNGTTFEQIARDLEQAHYLIIESNQILNEITPDCVIYLTGKKPKPSAVMAREKANIIRCTMVEPKTVISLSRKLDLSKTIIRKIVWLSGARPENTSAIILAGGKSTRMGKDKALLDIQGENAVARLYHLLTPFFDEVILSLNAEQDVPLKDDVRVVRDSENNRGPLMGLYSALKVSGSAVNFAVACDIPDIDHPLLFKQLAFSEEYDVVVPSFKEGQFEPLFAVYNKSVTALVKNMLDQNKRRIFDIYSECKTKIVSVTEHGWYINLNTQKDYENYCMAVTKKQGTTNEYTN